MTKTVPIHFIQISWLLFPGQISAIIATIYFIATYNYNLRRLKRFNLEILPIFFNKKYWSRRPWRLYSSCDPAQYMTFSSSEIYISEHF